MESSPSSDARWQQLMAVQGELDQSIVTLPELVGRDFKSTLALAALGGGLLLVTGDAAARTVIAPQEVPVGVLAALIGTPLLLILIRREMRGRP